MNKHYSVSRDNKYLYIKNTFDGLNLYRFVSVNEYSIDSLASETLWGGLPSNFNDPFDSTGVSNCEMLKQLVIDYHINNPEFFDPAISGEQAANDIAHNLTSGINENRDIFLATCFTPNITSEIMWAHYGKNGTGFALQYSPEDIIGCAKQYVKEKFGVDDASRAVRLSHVLYTDGVIDLTPAIQEVIGRLINQFKENRENINLAEVYNIDVDLFRSMLYRKNTCWSYEDEYRLTVPNHHKENSDESPNYVCLGHCKPTAVYLGYGIKNDHEAILTRIAKEKRIPVFKMAPEITAGKYELSFDEMK